MVLRAALPLGLRIGAGHGLWSVVAFAFPSIALLQEEHFGVALLLFLAETIAALAILGVRLATAWRASASDPALRARLRRTRDGTKGVLLMVFVCAAWGVGLAGLTLVLNPPEDLVANALARGGPMLGALLLAAVLDTAMAPVRAPEWLEAGLAWQASRTSVVVVSILAGLPFAWYFGLQTFAWTFLGLRLMADAGGLRRSERERIRAQMFDGSGTPDLTVRDTAKAPPPFAATYARHEANDPRRLPD